MLLLHEWNSWKQPVWVNIVKYRKESSVGAHKTFLWELSGKRTPCKHLTEWKLCWTLDILHGSCCDMKWQAREHKHWKLQHHHQPTDSPGSLNTAPKTESYTAKLPRNWSLNVAPSKDAGYQQILPFPSKVSKSTVCSDGKSCSHVERAPSCGLMNYATFNSNRVGKLYPVIVSDNDILLGVITSPLHSDIISKTSNLQTRLEVGIYLNFP